MIFGCLLQVFGIVQVDRSRLFVYTKNMADKAEVTEGREKKTRI